MSSSLSTATETLPPDRCLHASLESGSFHLLLHLLRLEPVDSGEEKTSLDFLVLDADEGFTQGLHLASCSSTRFASSYRTDRTHWQGTRTALGKSCMISVSS